MKEKMKLFGRCTAFLLILLILLSVASYIFMPKNNKKEFGMDVITANGILGEKENTIDVLIVGDSESYCSFTPMYMWEKHGFTSYVCGTPGQPLYDSYRFLEKAFKYQKPSVVILETDTIFREYKYSKHLLSRMQGMFPVFQYHNRWKSVTINDFGSSIDYTWTNDHKGYYLNQKVIAGSDKGYMTPTDEIQDIPDLNRRCLKDIIDICQKNDAKLIFVGAPTTKNWDYAKHNGVQEFADKHDIEYLDMNLIWKELGIDWATDTRDRGDHLNHSGAVKVTDYLGKYLKEKFTLPDHRDDAAYSAWDEALKRYNASVLAGE